MRRADNPPRTDEEAMLLSSNLSEKDIERLYSDFLDHCFPSMAMAFHSFRVYMTKYGFQFEDERLTHLFFAFNSFLFVRFSLSLFSRR